MITKLRAEQIARLKEAGHKAFYEQSGWSTRPTSQLDQTWWLIGWNEAQREKEVTEKKEHPNNIAFAMVEWLRDHKDKIVERVEIRALEYDPTYGPRSIAKYVEIVDFDALLREIDEFSRQFEEDDS